MVLAYLYCAYSGTQAYERHTTDGSTFTHLKLKIMILARLNLTVNKSNLLYLIGSNLSVVRELGMW